MARQDWLRVRRIAGHLAAKPFFRSRPNVQKRTMANYPRILGHDLAPHGLAVARNGSPTLAKNADAHRASVANHTSQTPSTAWSSRCNMSQWDAANSKVIAWSIAPPKPLAVSLCGSSQLARTIRRSSRRDSKIPQACPAGYLCFVASQ